MYTRIIFQFNNLIWHSYTSGPSLNITTYKTPIDSIYLTNYTLVLIVVIKEFTLIYIKDIYSLTDSLFYLLILDVIVSRKSLRN